MDHIETWEELDDTQVSTRTTLALEAHRARTGTEMTCGEWANMEICWQQDFLRIDVIGNVHHTERFALAASMWMTLQQLPVAGPCPCDCNRGGFCGGCGHAGCGGRRRA